MIIGAQKGPILNNLLCCYKIIIRLVVKFQKNTPEFRIVLKIWWKNIHGQWRQHGGRISDSQSVVVGFKTRRIQPLAIGEREREREKKIRKKLKN